MNDEQLERHVRAAAQRIADGPVSPPFRARVAALPAEHPRPERRVGKFAVGLRFAGSLAVVLVLLATAGLVALLLGTIVQPGGPVPSPASSFVHGFVEQTDGLYGYRMLRPANWVAEPPSSWLAPEAQPGPGRTYTAEIPPSTGLLGLGATNLVSRSPGDVDLEAFRRHPTIEGWSAAEQAGWNASLHTTLIRTLPSVRIYWVTQAGYAGGWLFGLAVDQGQPLSLGLSVGGALASLEALERSGMVEDFATMLASMRAIPLDPHNVSPALPTAQPTGVASSSP